MKGYLSMKKLFAPALLCALVLALCACGGTPEEPADDAAPTGGGRINVTVLNEDSAIYSEEDIDAAVETVIDYFGENFTGCTLTKLGYAGDEVNRREADFLDQYGGDELIVLSSSFDVDASGGDGSLNPDSTYDGWNWILVRDTGGDWRHADHGY